MPKSKPRKLFSEFPTTIYITYQNYADGDYLAWKDKKDAAEDAIRSGSEVAVYSLAYHDKATVEYTVKIG